MSKKFLNVMGILFEVRYKENVLDSDGTDVCGTTDGATRVIEISTTANKTEDLQLSSLIHEFCHAVFYVTGQSQHLAAVHVEFEESIVMNMEHALVQAGFVPEFEEEEEEEELNVN